MFIFCLNNPNLCTNGWDGVDARGDPEAVPVTQLLPHTPVKTDPGCIATVWRDRYLQLHPCRHHNGPKRNLFYQLKHFSSVLYLKERLCGHIGVTITAGTLG